ncbi:MAG: putative bifunctional diguanylate cyclase/phosphodiesterase [Parvibaculaceae bacterium]
MRFSARAAETKQGDVTVPGGALTRAQAFTRQWSQRLLPTVRAKLVALLCAIGFVIVLLSTVFVFNIYYSQADGRAFERATTLTDVIARATADARSPQDADELIGAFRSLPAISVVVIAGPKGKIFASTLPDLKGRDIGDLGWDTVEQRLGESGGKLVRARKGETDLAQAGLVEFARHVEVGFVKGPSTIYVRLNLAPMLDTVRAAVWGLLVWLVAIVIIAVLVISLVLQRVLVTPIEALRDFAVKRDVAGLGFVTDAKDDISVIANLLTEAFDTTSSNAERLADLAQTDGLTGLPNRVQFRAHLTREIAKANGTDKIVGVLILNLDSFKVINDSLGHDVGDLILQRTADILRGCQRSGDAIARLGADEFGVILSGLSVPDDTSEAANRFIRAVGAPFRAAGHELHQTACVGLTVFPQDGRDADVLLKNADLALSRAKQEGSGACVFYRHELHLRAMERNSIERDLRAALAQRQFVLYYQPKVDIMTGEIKGAEALIRWMHPERGLVPPDMFIPVAERCGIISDITRFVMDEACRQNREWQDMGLPKIGVAVNVSAVDLRRADLTDLVANTLVVRGLSPQYLELEVTESMVMRDVDVVIGTLRRLRSLGVGIGIDDFGTGYSSLAYLKRFPVKRLKIDRSFISDIADGRSGTIIPKVIIDLAHALGMEVLAEGVEDMMQLEILRALGCDEAQGYFLGRPVPAGEFAEFLKQSEGAIHPRDDIRTFVGVAPRVTIDVVAELEGIAGAA